MTSRRSTLRARAAMTAGRPAFGVATNAGNGLRARGLTMRIFTRTILSSDRVSRDPARDAHRKGSNSMRVGWTRMGAALRKKFGRSFIRGRMRVWQQVRSSGSTTPRLRVHHGRMTAEKTSLLTFRDPDEWLKTLRRAEGAVRFVQAEGQAGVEHPERLIRAPDTRNPASRGFLFLRLGVRDRLRRSHVHPRRHRSFARAWVSRPSFGRPALGRITNATTPTCPPAERGGLRHPTPSPPPCGEASGSAPKWHALSEGCVGALQAGARPPEARLPD